MGLLTMNDPAAQVTAEPYRGDLLDFKLVSADSHITEPPNLYPDYIDPAFRDRAPHVEKEEDGGEAYIVPGLAKKIQLGLVAAAGIRPEVMRMDRTRFEELHRGGWDPKQRIADQDRDGVIAEIIYPSIGMVLCNHPDTEFKQACFWAYNRWLQEFVGAAPTRLYGLGQTAVTSVEQTIKDFEQIRAMGFKGVMMPCNPATEFDYDDARFDPVWQASIDLELPLSFHILTSGGNSKHVFGAEQRGKKLANAQHLIIRANQDVIALFIWAGIFERFPELKLVCAEADAGWAPHFMYRLDHYYKRHRFHSNTGDMATMPSQQFRNNVYLTFQDDWSAFQQTHLVNPRRLLWANDFPHSDSTWPLSRHVLDEQTELLTKEQKRWILRDNTAELYKLDLAS
jgi:predicted TIM-barrel fold metal-dependent hydrolase